MSLTFLIKSLPELLHSIFFENLLNNKMTEMPQIIQTLLLFLYSVMTHNNNKDASVVKRHNNVFI